MKRLSPWNDQAAIEDNPKPANPDNPSSWWWDDDRFSSNSALRGRDGSVLRVVIQAGSNWAIYDGDVLLDIRGDREAARDRALETFLSATRISAV